eukprot:4349415-Prymnesium_polylepis.1
MRLVASAPLPRASVNILVPDCAMRPRLFCSSFFVMPTPGRAKRHGGSPRTMVSAPQHRAEEAAAAGADGGRHHGNRGKTRAPARVRPRRSRGGSALRGAGGVRAWASESRGAAVCTPLSSIADAAGVAAILAIVGEREEALLIARVARVRDQLAQEDVLVRVERVDDNVHHLAHLRLKLIRLAVDGRLLGDGFGHREDARRARSHDRR